MRPDEQSAVLDSFIADWRRSLESMDMNVIKKVVETGRPISLGAHFEAQLPVLVGTKTDDLPPTPQQQKSTCGGAPKTPVIATVSGINKCIPAIPVPNGVGVMVFIGTGSDPFTGDDVCKWSNPSVIIGGASFNFELVLFTSGPSTGLWRLRIDDGTNLSFENDPGAFGILANRPTVVTDCGVTPLGNYVGYGGSATLS